EPVAAARSKTLPLILASLPPQSQTWVNDILLQLLGEWNPVETLGAAATLIHVSSKSGPGRPDSIGSVLQNRDARFAGGVLLQTREGSERVGSSTVAVELAMRFLRSADWCSLGIDAVESAIAILRHAHQAGTLKHVLAGLGLASWQPYIAWITKDL